MKKTVWTFGLISGGILSAMMVGTMPFEDQIGFDRSEIIGYTTMVLAFLLIYFGIRSYRDNVAGGSVSFGRALAVGSLIAVIASACYVATWEVLFYKFIPDFRAKYETYMIDRVKTSGAGQAEIDKQLADMKKFSEMYQNPLVNAAVTFLEPLPVALFMTLLSAGVLRRRRGELSTAPSFSSQ